VRQRYYRGKRPLYRRSRTLNYVPRPGQFCLGRRPDDLDPDAQPGDLLPLACFDTLQEALEAEDNPTHQGFTSRHGVPRKILCSRRARTENMLAGRNLWPKDHRMVVFEVAGCDNRTKHPDGWNIPASELTGLDAEETLLTLMFTGVAIAALVLLRE
jgi:hypothetical protein